MITLAKILFLLFLSKFYNPIDRVAMGSPLSPVLANIFMVFYKSKWLNEYNLNKPKFYLWYIDDILAAFDNEQDSLSFLDFLNNRHPNIKFMIEKQMNHSITFLDVFISGIWYVWSVRFWLLSKSHTSNISQIDLYRISEWVLYHFSVRLLKLNVW